MLPLQKFHRLDLIFPMHIPFLFTAITAAVLIPYLQTDLANPDKVHLTTWWIVLCCISVFNIAWWTISAMTVLGSRSTTNNNVKTTSRVPKQGVSEMNSNFEFSQVILSAGYVFGCAFRSIVPRADVQRICLIDNWISTVLVGRAVATVAELCFAAQWAVVLYKISLDLKCPNVHSISKILFPMIVMAEIFSWYACFTTNYIGNVIEESTWAVSSFLMIVSFIILLQQKITKNMRNFLLLSALFSFGYLLFMCFVDVPMYFSRLLEDISTGKQFLSFYEGYTDLNTRWIVTYSYQEWETEIPWMTGYFSVGVWVSIALIFTPLK